MVQSRPCLRNEIGQFTSLGGRMPAANEALVPHI